MDATQAYQMVTVFVTLAAAWLARPKVRKP